MGSCQPGEPTLTALRALRQQLPAWTIVRLRSQPYRNTAMVAHAANDLDAHVARLVTSVQQYYERTTAVLPGGPQSDLAVLLTAAAG